MYNGGSTSWMQPLLFPGFTMEGMALYGSIMISCSQLRNGNAKNMMFDTNEAMTLL
jgi:hypothetical protein